MAALIDGGPDGEWATTQLASGPLMAPHLMPAEVANVLRRGQMAGVVSGDAASLAHADLLDLRVQLVPYDAFAERVWDLRPNVSAHDAWYVAVAETFEIPLATLDGRLTTAAGPQCRFATPQGT